MRLDEEVLGIEAIGESAYRAFHAACEGMKIPAMEYSRTPWERIADVLSSNDGTYTVKELGQHVRNLYFSALATPADDFPLENLKDGIAWQAAALHFFNLIQGGGDRNLRSAEAAWASWALEQLSPAENN